MADGDLELRSFSWVPTPVNDWNIVRKDYADSTRWNVDLNTRTSSYTLAFGDGGKVVEMNSTASTTLTVPANATVGFPIGTSMFVCRIGSGAVTIAAASGVTINTANSLTMGAQYSTVWLRKRNTDQWILVAL